MGDVCADRTHCQSQTRLRINLNQTAGPKALRLVCRIQASRNGSCSARSRLISSITICLRSGGKDKIFYAASAGLPELVLDFRKNITMSPEEAARQIKAGPCQDHLRRHARHGGARSADLLRLPYQPVTAIKTILVRTKAPMIAAGTISQSGIIIVASRAVISKPKPLGSTRIMKWLTPCN
jgi:hypothetical protein